MSSPPATTLHIGEWRVDVRSNEISRHGETSRLDLRAMRLLLCLAEHPGEVLSIEDLIQHVWSGVNVAPDSVYQAVTSLRRVLGDDPKRPAYIETVPRLGYRMVAIVGPRSDASAVTPTPTGLTHAGTTILSRQRKPRRRLLITLIALSALCLVLAGLLISRKRLPRVASMRQTQNSVAVLPFLDLTDAMNEEPFADGMTEELIDKLSRVPDLRVPSPTSSFYFKGKKLTVSEIATKLGVAYVLDGSVRKSGNRLRVAARLIRADNGYVIWSESYDRRFEDRLWVQDDIAGEVAKALETAIENRPTS
jgi:transcriptional activator of cad operon